MAGWWSPGSPTSCGTESAERHRCLPRRPVGGRPGGTPPGREGPPHPGRRTAHEGEGGTGDGIGVGAGRGGDGQDGVVEAVGGTRGARVAALVLGRRDEHGRPARGRLLARSPRVGLSPSRGSWRHGRPRRVRGSAAVGMAAALTAIHAAKVAHRDLKPSNVLLSAVGPRVIDFGIARALEGPDVSVQPTQLSGTPGYIAPEVLRGGPVTPAADLFAWGCVMACAASGALPSRARTSSRFTSGYWPILPGSPASTVPCGSWWSRRWRRIPSGAGPPRGCWPGWSAMSVRMPSGPRSGWNVPGRIRPCWRQVLSGP
ncbi:protein kinase [Streptomyces roseolus]